MCILFFHQFPQASSEYLYAFVDNRDEFFDRPSTAAHWWSEEELATSGPHRRVFAGRDDSAGGTWLGISLPENEGTSPENESTSPENKSTSHGAPLPSSTVMSGCDAPRVPAVKFGVLTNFREVPKQSTEDKLQPLTRGRLALDFLLHPTATAKEAAGTIDGALYNGFNLLMADDKESVFVSNRPDFTVNTPEAGVTHGLSNTWLNGVHWPKIEIGTKSFDTILKNTINRVDLTREEKEEAFVQESLELMGNTLSDICHEGKLPGVYPPEVEVHLTGIHVPPFTMRGRTYGTRTSTLVLVRADHSVMYYEKNKTIETGEWSEQKVDL